MAEGDVTFYNNAKALILDGTIDLDDDTFNMILVSGHTPDIDAHHVLTDVSGDEYGTGSGYTSGGEVITNPAVATDDANDRATWDFDDVTWSSLGPLSPDTPSHAIIYDDTEASDSLICYIELGVTATNGGDFTIAPNATAFATLS